MCQWTFQLLSSIPLLISVKTEGPWTKMWKTQTKKKPTKKKQKLNSTILIVVFHDNVWNKNLLVLPRNGGTSNKDVHFAGNYIEK